MKFNVFNGEYPFDKHLGTVEAPDAETAHAKALELFGKVDHRCVVSPANGGGLKRIDAIKSAEETDHGHFNPS